MRTAPAILLCLSLTLSFAEAPFFHVHDEHGDDHDGLVLHTHQSVPHAPDHTEFDSADDDSDARELAWFQLERPAPQPLPIVFTSSPSAELPRCESARLSHERPRIHDPPGGAPLLPRAPPA